MGKNEIPLGGGRLTEGVVRIGDTVRRPHQSSSVFVGKLLTHLEQQNVHVAPQYMGVDTTGRDILSYLEGEVPSKFKRFTDEQIAHAARIIRIFHDATRNSDLADGYPVVCHHDAGPNNFVFREGMPYALIDFDLASPGDPLEDIGYMAWLWCLSSKSDRQPMTDQAEQVRLFVDSYGLNKFERCLVFDAVIERQTWNVGFWSEYLIHPKPEMVSHQQVIERIEWTERERAYTLENRKILMTALV